ncbi:MAG: NUDIX hydrolase [Sphingomonadaceae bacterium]
MAALPDPIPAATLVPMREKAVGPPEILFMERSAGMAFAAGALVFPGGRIEAGDRTLGRRLAPEREDAAARIAAIRETIEETGFAPALTPAEPAAVRALRDGLRDGMRFAELLEARGLALDLDALTPFSRWCPTFKEVRRFDTIFFLAEAPPGRQAPDAQEGEAERIFWADAAEILSRCREDRAHAIFPTRRNLERLARFSSLAEARDEARAIGVEKIVPWVEERDGEQWLCIPEGLGYPVTAEPLATARRI